VSDFTGGGESTGSASLNNNAMGKIASPLATGDTTGSTDNNTGSRGWEAFGGNQEAVDAFINRNKFTAEGRNRISEMGFTIQDVGESNQRWAESHTKR